MERVTPVVHPGAVGIVEAGVFEDGMSFGVGVLLGTGLLSCRCGFSLSLLSCPLWRESTFTLGKIVEASAVVVKPEVELQVLGGVLDVLEVVHEVADGAWLMRNVSILEDDSRED